MDRIIEDLPHWLHKLAAFQAGWGGFLKVVIAASGLVYQYFVAGPNTVDAAVGAGILVIFDTLTGFMAAVAQKRRRTSRRLSRVITKTFGYLAVVVVAAVAQKTIAKGSTLPLVDLVLWLVIATEGYSVLENVEKMGLGRFKALRKLLGKVVEDDDKEPEK